tara:strand:- start:657 stop:2429 length:1773 start_codon:yes stop_codon:yes gene_type:complete
MKKMWPMLRELIRRFPGHFIGLLALIFIQGGLNAVSIISIAPITDLLLKQSDSEVNDITSIFQKLLEEFGYDFNIVVVFIFFAIVMVVNGLAGVATVYATTRIKYDVLVHLLSDAMSSFYQARYQFFSQGKIGTLLNSFQYEVVKIGDTFGNFARILANLLQAIIFLGVPIIVNPKMTVVFLGSALVITAPLWLLRKYTYRLGKKLTTYGNDVGAVLEENLSFSKLVKGFGLSKTAVSGYQEKIKKITRISIYFGTITKSIQLLFVPLGTLAALLALYVSHSEGTSISDMAVVLFAFVRAIPMLGMVAQGKASIEGFMPAYEQIQNLQKEAKKLVEPTGQIKYQGLSEGIYFQDVSFNYESNRPAIKELNLRFNKGNMYALVGPSGAGKTTVIDLLLGLYRQDSGVISLDDVELEQYDLDSFRSRVGYVPQEPQLFNASVRENLLWASPNSDQKQIWKACRLANAEQFVKQMPKGLDTAVGDKGVRLSGGQRQRLALARAIIREPDFLILDEATSSLDTESEQLIQQSIEHLKDNKNMVIIVIAHRLSTIKTADEIYLLEHGSIVERGSYHELLDDSGSRLSELVRQQAL